MGRCKGGAKICCFFLFARGGKEWPKRDEGYRIKTGSLLNVLSFYKSFMGPA